jgi:putative DNA primase/helicase
LDHTSSIVTKRASVKFNPDADCPNFKAFFREIMGGDEDLIRYVRRVLGYCITGHTGEQACFIAIGSGANGKSTLFSVVQKVLGDYAGDTPMQTLMQSRYGDQNTYDLAALEGKRLVIAQEGEASSKLAEAKLKSMTGGDPIACRPIYGKPKTYDPRFKIVLVTNELPKIEGVDEAIWRRIKVIPFNVTIPKDERDPYLKEKLLGEREGILNFLMECFQDYEAARKESHGSGLLEPDVVKKEIENYRAETDSVGMFIKLKCIEGKGRSSSTKHLYKAYCDWCDEHGIDEPLSSAHFGRNLGRKGYTQYKTSAGNGWKGIDIQYYDIDKVCPIRGKVQDTSKFRRDEFADLLWDQEPAESE